MLRVLVFAGQAAIQPWATFPARAAENPTLGQALGRMLFLRTPVVHASGCLTYRTLEALWNQLRTWEGALPRALETILGPHVQAGDLQAIAQTVTLPSPGIVAGILLGLAPLGVLSLWLHDVVWDHGALWLLGVRPSRGAWRATAIAEAEALASGSIGVGLGLLGWIPGLGSSLVLPLLGLQLWFWVQRGFALAAWHRCPIGKGVAATLLHAALALGLGMLGLGVAGILLLRGHP